MFISKAVGVTRDRTIAPSSEERGPGCLLVEYRPISIPDPLIFLTSASARVRDSCAVPAMAVLNGVVKSPKQEEALSSPVIEASVKTQTHLVLLLQTSHLHPGTHTHVRAKSATMHPQARSKVQCVETAKSDYSRIAAYCEVLIFDTPPRLMRGEARTIDCSKKACTTSFSSI